MLYYRLAGIKVGIECENDYLINRMKPFQTEPTADIDMEINIKPLTDFKEPEGEMLVGDKVKWLRKPDPEEGYIIYTTREDDKRAVIMNMDASADWRRVDLYVQKNCYMVHESQGVTRWENLYSFIFCGIAFRNMLMLNDGLVIHSSSIAFRNMGIIFSAPSGTGKSTHVRLWEESFGSEVTVVNDDTPAIRFENGVPMLSGTPWSGSSDKFASIQVPLKAIVLLEQYGENIIRRLSPLEALPMLMPRCFLPYYDEAAMIIAYGLIEKLLDKVDVYHLRCLPDKDAVEQVYKCIM